MGAPSGAPTPMNVQGAACTSASIYRRGVLAGQPTWTNITCPPPPTHTHGLRMDAKSHVPPHVPSHLHEQQRDEHQSHRHPAD